MRSTIVHAVRRAACGVAVVLACVTAAHAQAASVPDRADPFARRGWHLELGGHGALEAWNYNISHEEMFGIRAGVTYGLREGLVVTAGWPLYYISQRGVDGYALGATAGLRGRVYRRGSAAVFLECELGVSEADTSVPPRGTRFNYFLLGGAGATFRVGRGLHLLTGMKLIHVSNNGIAGRDRNPDIEAIGPHAALLLRF